MKPPFNKEIVALLSGEGGLSDAAALIKRVLKERVLGGASKPVSGGKSSGRAPAEVLRGLRDFGRDARQLREPTGPGRFLAASFTGPAGSRPYKLYIPSGYRDQKVSLIVMLHGCTQSPDDFAAGTGMNAAAEDHTFLVAYPGQTAAANSSKCWNWFNAGDQQRDCGEPSLIAGITRRVMAEYAVDPRRVFVAGLSAGGAAAAIMGARYPDLYAAIGVHSGLACGAASDLSSAFAAMRQGSHASGPRARSAIPAIVFHGEQDSTVHPSNADAVIEQAAAAVRLTPRHLSGRVPGGHAYRRTLYIDASGATVIERWTIAGAGHAWSGGNPAGSYTDPRGPDATREMLRFFLDHPHAGLT